MYTLTCLHQTNHQNEHTHNLLILTKSTSSYYQNYRSSRQSILQTPRQMTNPNNGIPIRRIWPIEEWATRKSCRRNSFSLTSLLPPPGSISRIVQSTRQTNESQITIDNSKSPGWMPLTGAWCTRTLHYANLQDCIMPVSPSPFPANTTCYRGGFPRCVPRVLAMTATMAARSQSPARSVYLEHRRFAMNKQQSGFFETI